MKAYRIVVTIECYDDEEQLLEEDAEPEREITQRSVTKDYGKAKEVMSEALSQFDVDPIHGYMWE